MKFIFSIPLSALLLLSALAPDARAQFGGFDIENVISGASGAAKVVKGAAGISLQEELDLGGSLACEIAMKQGGILKNEALTRRVATLGKALTLYCTRPDLNFTFAVLDNPDINAFSCPGGYVFVTKGLVDSCESDRPLAAVLAHEISHITRRHALKLIARNETMKGLTELGSAAAGGNYSGFDDLISKGIETILEKGFDPATEFDADKHGTLLAYEAGFPPRSLRDYLTTLSQKSENHIFSTHPPTDHRVERLDEFLDESGLAPKRD